MDLHRCLMFLWSFFFLEVRNRWVFHCFKTSNLLTIIAKIDLDTIIQLIVCSFEAVYP
jgi:predicted membrane channel-forming protein YqfA (hemolysin III family)